MIHSELPASDAMSIDEKLQICEVSDAMSIDEFLKMCQTNTGKTKGGILLTLIAEL